MLSFHHHPKRIICLVSVLLVLSATKNLLPWGRRHASKNKYCCVRSTQIFIFETRTPPLFLRNVRHVSVKRYLPTNKGGMKNGIYALHASLSMSGTELYAQSAFINKFGPKFAPKSLGQTFPSLVGIYYCWLGWFFSLSVGKNKYLIAQNRQICRNKSRRLTQTFKFSLRPSLEATCCSSEKFQLGNRKVISFFFYLDLWPSTSG